MGVWCDNGYVRIESYAFSKTNERNFGVWVSYLTSERDSEIDKFVEVLSMHIEG